MMKTSMLLLAFVATVALADESIALMPSMPSSISSLLAEIGGVPGQTNAGGLSDQCSDPKLLNCVAKFNAAMGIEGDADWRDPALLLRGISRVLNSGREGLVATCNARQGFQYCLGAAYYPCLDPLFFLKHNYGFDKSYTYLGIMQSLQFMCVSGFQEGVENWPCILQTMNQQDAALTQCISTFNTTVYTDPSKYCTAGATLVNCYKKPFADACNYNGESEWWACQDASYAFLLEHCKLPCPVTTKSV